MKKVSTQLLKKYQRIYRKEPGSRVFALLADLYRQNGELEKALALCHKGVKKHPHFAIGHLTLALILLDMNQLNSAVQSLDTAASLSPDSLLVHRLLGQVWMQLKDPIKTLNAYKMVLFLDPKNKKAINVVRKLEPLTADQYDHTGFDFKQIEEVGESAEKNLSIQSSKKPDSFESNYSDLSSKNKNEVKQFALQMAMVTALTYRKNIDKAREFLKGIKRIYGPKKNFKKYIQQLEESLPFPNRAPSKLNDRDRKIRKLRYFLRKIEQYSKDNSSLANNIS